MIASDRRSFPTWLASLASAVYAPRDARSGFAVA